MSKYSSGTVPRFLGKTSKALSNAYRGTGSRLSNVELPFAIRAIGYIQSDPRQSVCLVSCPPTSCTQSQPAACDKETLVAIDVKSLPRCPPFRSARFVVLFGRQLVLVRQNVALNDDFARGSQSVLRG